MFYDFSKQSKRIISVVLFILFYLLFTTIFGIAALFEAEQKIRTFIFLLPNLFWIKAPICIVLVYLMVYINNSSLDIDTRRVGHGQHGSARWMTEDEKKKDYCFVSFGAEKEPGFVVGVNMTQKNWIIDTSDNTALNLAPPGGGKTLCNIIPTICYNAKVHQNTGSGASFILTDCKGDLYRKTKKLLEASGIQTLLLDFRFPLNSLRYNLMHNINVALDRYKESTKKKDKLYYYARAEKYAKILADSIVENLDTNNKSDASAYFDETAKGLITSLILLVSEYGEPGERHIISVFKLIIELNGLDESSNLGEGLQRSKMEQLLNVIDNDRLINYAGSSIKADVRTSMNIYSTALGKLANFIDAELEQLVCDHSPEISAESFVEKPTAIFLVCPDENTTRHFFASLFIRNFSNELIELAESKYHGRLPVPVLNLWDEFGNMPAVKDIDVLFTAIRSRNVRTFIALQSYRQLEKNYTKEKAQIIREACQMLVFTYVSPAAQSTAKELSDTLGKETVLSGSVSSGKGYTSTKQMIGKPLLTPDEIINMGFENYVVMKSGHRPMKSTLPLYFKYLPKLEEYEEKMESEIKEINYLSIDKVKINAKRSQLNMYVGMFD